MSASYCSRLRPKALEEAAMCAACMWVACTDTQWSQKGSGKGAVAMTNQHCEQATRWDVWIICSSGRPIRAKDNSMLMLYKVLFDWRKMTFFVFGNKLIRLSLCERQKNTAGIFPVNLSWTHLHKKCSLSSMQHFLL